MKLEVLQSVWPVLAILGYFLVVAMTRVLSNQRDSQLKVHDRIVQARELRREYRQAVRDRQDQL